MSHSRKTETRLLKMSVLFLIVFIANGKKLKKPLQEPCDDSEDIDADVFCKKVSRLIRMEKADEIFVVDANLNDSIQLQCKYCEEKDNSLPKMWSMQRHIFTGNIMEVSLDMDNDPSSSSVFMTKSHSLVIRNVQTKHLGLYFCKPPYIESPDKSFNYLIDMIVESGKVKTGNIYDLKNYVESYLLPVNEILGNRIFLIHNLHINVQVFIDWSDWSECDSCLRKEGMKNRMGRCRVKPICWEGKECAQNRNHLRTFQFTEFKMQNSGEEILNEREIMSPKVVRENLLILAIPLSCRSLLLKRLTPILYEMTSMIPDFMLTEKCSYPCKKKPNRKSPRYKKSIILAKGAHLTLVCPDSTIDSHVIWEHNRKRLYPNEGADYNNDEPHQYVDSYNTLYLFEVTDLESGNYTCFVNGIRMQEVTVIVLTRSIFFTKEFTRHLKNLGLMFMLCFFIYLIGVTFMCVEFHSKSRNIKKKQKIAEDRKRLLGSLEGSGSDN